MQITSTETKRMTINRYKTLLKEFNDLCLSPSQDTEQRFKAVQRQINAIREMLIWNKITIEEEALEQ